MIGCWVLGSGFWVMGDEGKVCQVGRWPSRCRGATGGLVDGENRAGG
ncbi:hypothetical protein VDG1235_1893 [Verrucomicrobiia bacterium DG1235]|nr:hypothetical protein VDG1235_1893 [Verrucomicrobiae bacterium DG1235]